MLSESGPTGPGAAPASGEAIAVIGMACRLPGAADPDAFWRLLRSGTEAVTEVPAGRWEADGRWSPEGGRTGRPARRGGFLDHVDRFDAEFFGVSPREAVAMDPQQRLVLELSWESLEDARIDAGRLHGSRTGVFIGAIADDYAAMLRGHGQEAVTPHSMTGLHRGMIANRVSYVLGLRGPSLTVDTGQSSSLVSVHMACESLLREESELAVAGGVNLNIAAEATATAESFGALSPDGRCYTFDARANGYVRGEGGGAVVLKPLSRALADGDRIHSVILGGAVNNDGATDGLTLPGRPGQEEVLRLACRRAGVDPRDVDYVELHGTGTRAGDPVEAAALGAVLGDGRSAGSPLLVGSAKTNVGHLEGAAGITGLLKAVLSIAHRELPPSLNHETPNPEIPLDGLNLRVQCALAAWPERGRPPLAGVSAFGMGGTNCHLVLSEPPPPGRGDRPSPEDDRGAADSGAPAPLTLPWVVSGRSEAALREQAGRLRALVAADPGLRPVDVGFSLATTRSHFEHRAVVLAEDRAGFADGLDAIASGVPAPGAVLGEVGVGGADPGKVVFVFPGQGSQWVGMGVELLGSSPVFAEWMAACADVLAPYVDWSLVDVLRGERGAPSLDRVDVVQPVLWAVMVSLAGVWRSWGVEPAAVVGYSQGEVAAACVAGALSLEDGAKVTALFERGGPRGRCRSPPGTCGALLRLSVIFSGLGMWARWC
ncbi:acyl transferase domain-containing protein [Spinactinospora alkalitolerans]|uniref:Acyl transferase domain-containing protein n=1 Tax=Spinactinospora alkalitolerans TaxID=687207 RepID=A0A852U1U4_9ACTN|nr:type I polyketide synthase [Spinactinospora alkalitolerans]NYE48134.1 acyl transferase domain-containing protein [Spinactinospora alkalitolerans]